ncbi:MAG: pyridoxal 5'-phosphate synthase glutaminase subunit PdxT [Nitrosopumilus sp.]|uniref:Pyridoxal 5'-phosphate synthase subunit PdxT n=1 Tax=Nitrosopumilus zosterae TaxID=718286 RepID=A0A2S2KRV4_9ARCH|nr:MULTISPECIES: pyridoxal 5'-phosphate synthase glutaminase subunit PdxT [Nitrosopumilus]MCV0366029.1 pyridoxal 5'-phosphate synthase glutaminase subunit PdxT [Nitrosopumilus sp.]BDQ30216.1 pyridoxal 5'-phosphate synthase glutaminase subunit PdxT [Nitrosopumilus zosterae]GBH34344.1 pyridoxal 5'-phosphate synthase glutaminase subunit PdxT [Nitrosopumilus zosterae]
MSLNVGVLSIQGDVQENLLSVKAAIDELGIDGKVLGVKTPEEISKLDGLIIPGGESTTIGQLSLVNGSLKVLKEKIENGMPVLGICAGMIMLSNSASDRIIGETDQPLLNILDIKLERNSFGRQKESFEADVSLDSIGIPKFTGVFIRAPSVSDVGSDVEILSKFNDRIIAVKKGNVIGTSFHPELTKDFSLHKYFINLVKSLKN